MARTSEIFTVEEAAARLGLPVALVARKLTVSARSFFATAFQDAHGTWFIPERELRRFANRKLEQLYSLRSAAEWLEMSYFTLQRAAKSGKIRTKEVLGEIRVTESELLRIQKDGVSGRALFLQGKGGSGNG